MTADDVQPREVARRVLAGKRQLYGRERDWDWDRDRGQTPRVAKESGRAGAITLGGP